MLAGSKLIGIVSPSRNETRYVVSGVTGPVGEPPAGGEPGCGSDWTEATTCETAVAPSPMVRTAPGTRTSDRIAGAVDSIRNTCAPAGASASLMTAFAPTAALTA